MLRHIAISIALFGWALGCAPPPEIPVTSPVPYSPPFDPQHPVAAPGADSPVLPPTSLPPVVSILAPEPGSEVDAEWVVVEVEIEDDDGAVALQASVNGSPVRTLVPPARGGFSFDLILPVGPISLEVRVWDAAGGVGSAAVDFSRLASTDPSAPTVAILSPAPSSSTAAHAVEVWGAATAGAGLAEVRIVSPAAPEGVWAQSADGFATWYASVPLLAGQSNAITALATDGLGAEAQAAIVVHQTGAAGGDAVWVTVDAPVSGAAVGPVVVASGQFGPPGQVQAVMVQQGDGPFVWIPSAAGSEWQHPLVIAAPGPQTLRVVAVGFGGGTAEALREFTLPGSEPVHQATLRLKPPNSNPVELQMTRELLASALPAEKAEQVVILHLDPTPMMTAALELMKGLCGSGWNGPGFLPVCPDAWGQPERNMWRLLTMTPATSDVSDTSFENLEEIANVLSTYDNLIDDFSTLLALTLGRLLYDPLISTDSLAGAIRDLLIASHPASLPDGRLPVTLRDALEDMAPLASRFGPSADHPGFLVGQTQSQVFADDFLLTIEAESNLHWHDGVSLSKGKGFAAFLGAGASQVLSADFLDEAKFKVQGLAKDPAVSLSFAMKEHPDLLVAGNSPWPEGQGNSPAWQAAPYTIERVVADAARRDFVSYRAGCSMCAGTSDGALLWEISGVVLQDNDLAEVVIGEDGYSLDGEAPKHFPLLDPNPAGWMRVWTLGGLGYPAGLDKWLPWSVGYVWDIVLEVAQRRLMDGGVPQGAADVVFPLEGVPVGLSEEELVAGVREAMQDSEAVLMELMLGHWYANSDPIELFWGEVNVQGGNVEPMLLLAAPGDPTPELGSGGMGPTGYFADPQGEELVGIELSADAFLPRGPGEVLSRRGLAFPVGQAWQGPYFVRDANGIVYSFWGLRRSTSPTELQLVWRQHAEAAP